MANKTTIVYTTVDENGVEKQTSIANAKAGITRKEAEDFAKALAGLTSDTYVNSAIVKRTETGTPDYAKLPPMFIYLDNATSRTGPAFTLDTPGAVLVDDDPENVGYYLQITGAEGAIADADKYDYTWNASKQWYELELTLDNMSQAGFFGVYDTGISHYGAIATKFVAGYTPVLTQYKTSSYGDDNNIEVVSTGAVIAFDPPAKYESFANPNGYGSANLFLLIRPEDATGAQILFPADQDHAPVLVTFKMGE